MLQIVEFIFDSLIAIALGVMISLIGQVVIQTPNVLKKRRLKRLLNFPKSQPLFFVYPPRWQDQPFVLPRTSTEDFMAMNNAISALLSIGWSSEKIVIRDTDRFSDIHGGDNNIIVFCSPKSNSFAKEVQERLLQDKIRHYHFVEMALDGSNKQWAISDGHGYYPSSAARIIKEYQEQEAKLKVESEMDQPSEHEPRPLHDLSLVDVATVTKVQNPWQPEKQIMLIAGVRGIGTWGAAETVKKWYDSIYKQKKGWLEKSRKHGSFSALLEIHYRNSDIVKVEVLGLIDIDD